MGEGKGDTMTQPTKPSAGVAAAATAIVKLVELEEGKTLPFGAFDSFQSIIEKGTNHTELLEALKVAREWIGRVPQEYSASESISLDAAQEQVEQAIAKCEEKGE